MYRLLSIFDLPDDLLPRMTNSATVHYDCSFCENKNFHNEIAHRDFYYCPLNSGDLFSLNALIPSVRSAVVCSRK